MFVMVDYYYVWNLEEMTEKSCKYGEYGLSEHLLFSGFVVVVGLFVVCFFFGGGGVGGGGGAFLFFVSPPPVVAMLAHSPTIFFSVIPFNQYHYPKSECN